MPTKTGESHSEPRLARNGEERLRAILDRMTEMVWAATTDGEAVGDMSSWRAYTGQSEDEVRGRGWLDAVHPDDRPLLDACWGEAAPASGVYTQEIDIRRHDGEHRTLLVQAVQVLTGEGREWVGACEDVTERRQVERTLRLSEERFRAIALHVPVGIFQTDPGGDCVFVNDRWRAIAGLTQEEALGPSWSRALHPDDREMIFAEWYAAAAAKREFCLEYRFKSPDGRVTWVIGSAIALHGADGEVIGYFGTITDITERKRAEDALRQVVEQQEIIRTQQLALRELSTPLIPISDRIMVMPLIGTLDSRRVVQIMETLLRGAVDRGATVVVLDITGVAVVDTQVANAILRAARAVKLVGAQMVLSGIRPEVAQTLVGLGTDLTGVVTCGTLQNAIAYAMKVAR